MKRLILLAVLALSGTGAFAQGTITFNNTASSHVVWAGFMRFYGQQFSGPVAAEYGIRVGLYFYNGSDFTLVSPTPIVGTSSTGATNSALNGYFNGGIVTVPGLLAGQDGTFQVRFWSGDYPSEEAARVGGARFIGYLGENISFRNPSGGAVDPGTGILGPPASLTGFSGLNVFNPIPEPSVLALVGLGLGALVMIRRRV